MRMSKSFYGRMEVSESGYITMGRESMWSSWWKDVIENISGERGYQFLE